MQLVAKKKGRRKGARERECNASLAGASSDRKEQSEWHKRAKERKREKSTTQAKVVGPIRESLVLLGRHLN